LACSPETADEADSRSRDGVAERADLIQANRYVVAALQREVVRRDDAGSCQEHGAVRKAGLFVEIVDERLQIALHLGESRRRPERDRSTPADLQIDAARRRERLTLNEDARAEG